MHPLQFGQDRLAAGSGVLDIAGGKGELSFELHNLNGIPTTVIDPRPMRLDRFVKRQSSPPPNRL